MTEPVLTKAVGTLTPADDDESPNGSFELILSTPDVDRDGESLKAEEWQQPLPSHITFDADHAMSVVGTVGSGVPTIDDQDRLVVAGTYASTPLAQEVRSLVNEGHIRSASVAFLEHGSTKDGKGKVTRELLNGAFVAIPANPAARVLTSKSGARNSASDMEHLQAIHDHATAAGADCAPVKSVKGHVAVKSIVDSVEALQDRVSDALEDAYGPWSTSLRGVLPSGDLTSGGTVVFDRDDGDTYQQPYSDDGAVVTLTGDPTEIDVHEVIAPDADREPDAEPDPSTLSATAANNGTATRDVDYRLLALAAGAQSRKGKS